VTPLSGPFLQRPPHWLPHEPIVWAYEPAEDGSREVVLELGGRIAYSSVASDHESMMRCLEGVREAIDEDLLAHQPPEPAP
jgi:hypothetical protein